MFLRRITSMFCVLLLLTGCNNLQSRTSSIAASTSGGEVDLSPLEETPLEELSLVETPTVERNTSPTARSIRIAAGTLTPYGGRLLNDEAMSYMHTASTTLEDECGAAIRRQRDRDAARLSLDVGELRLQINSDRDRFRIILDGRDREISRLLALNTELSRDANSFPWDAVLAGVGAGALGLVIGFVTGTLYNP